MIRFASIRLILDIVAQIDIELYQMDIKTAFLNGELDVEIYKNQCCTPFRSNPIGGFEPDPGCSFNYFLFIYLFFKNVAIQIPGPTRMADSNWSLVYSDRFHLSCQNILFMSFHFRV